MSQFHLPDARWGAGWPEDRGALAGALAIAAAFPALVGPFQIFLSGDPNEALSGLLEDLKAQGISEWDLPDVALLPTRDAEPDLLHIGGLPLALAAHCEYERRARVSAFSAGDALHRKIWTAATRALAEIDGATATVITDSLDGFEDLGSGRVTVVSGCPLIRRRARREALTAVPRPPGARHLPAATFLVLDARRPDDLALAAGANAQTILVNTEGISNLALEAIGVSLGRDGLGARPDGCDGRVPDGDAQFQRRPELQEVSHLLQPAELHATHTHPLAARVMADTNALYLDLIERCLLNTIYEDPAQDPWSDPTFSAEKRDRGLDWPSQAHTMIGRKRMANVRHVVETALADGIPGDLIETGAWRGGASIYMRAILKANGVTDRTVYVADSFEGLPRPDPEKYPLDAGDQHYTFDALAISLDEVRDNFRKYDLLDDQVVFLKGWFSDTLPSAPASRYAVLRLDGDMYESTTDSLVNLYDKLSPGGFIIIDDYKLTGCRQAVTDFRACRGISQDLVDIDGVGSFWRKAF